MSYLWFLCDGWQENIFLLGIPRAQLNPISYQKFSLILLIRLFCYVFFYWLFNYQIYWLGSLQGGGMMATSYTWRCGLACNTWHKSGSRTQVHCVCSSRYSTTELCQLPISKNTCHVKLYLLEFLVVSMRFNISSSIWNLTKQKWTLH